MRSLAGGARAPDDAYVRDWLNPDSRALNPMHQLCLQVQINPLIVSAPQLTPDSNVRILDAKESMPRKAMLQMDRSLPAELPATPAPVTPSAQVLVYGKSNLLESIMALQCSLPATSCYKIL